MGRLILWILSNVSFPQKRIITRKRCPSGLLGPSVGLRINRPDRISYRPLLKTWSKSAWHRITISVDTLSEVLNYSQLKLRIANFILELIDVWWIAEKPRLYLRRMAIITVSRHTWETSVSALPFFPPASPPTPPLRMFLHICRRFSVICLSYDCGALFWGGGPETL